MSSKVYVKGKNGKTYVYENESYWDKETKKVKHKRKCIGHLENGEIVENHKKEASNMTLYEKVNEILDENCSYPYTIYEIIDATLKVLNIKKDNDENIKCMTYMLKENSEGE